MKQAFKEAYERELALLKERAAQFQSDFPGVASRLGGLLEENLDPSVAGLLEGAAFMAARVQLNIDQQFRTFSREMLDQVCPDATAPLPAAMLVQADPPGKPEDLVAGRRLNIGDYIEATFQQEDQRRITCRFRLAEPLDFWPVEIPDAIYHDRTTPLTALGIEAAPDTTAALVFTLRRTDAKALSDLAAPDLTVHFGGSLRDASALYEQAFCRVTRMSLVWEDELGDPVTRTVPRDRLAQIGFDPDAPLFGRDERLFPGFSTLLEYFAFPRKFLGLRLMELRETLRGIPASSVRVVLELDRPDPHLVSHFAPDMLRLFCTPAVNLFADDAKPIALDKRQHRLPVRPNRPPITHYEVQRITSVRAQYEGDRDKVEVLPLYAVPATDLTPRQTLYYTAHTERRGLSAQELRQGGTRYRYEGTDTWLTLYEPPEGDHASHLFVSTLCSNRHLPEILPMGDATFHLMEDRTVRMTCIAGPSEPREALAEIESEAPHRMSAGDNYWRLISVLSMSYRGFLGPDGSGNVDALRETLRLFSDVSHQLSETQINGITAMQAAPCIRTVRRAEGYLPTRGTRITLTFDENVFDTGGIVTLSAVLDRFFADSAAVNTFTETVAVNRKGTEIKRWPPRGGSGPLL
ncbi:type VI secretion system protein ImpG [Primorskyibacter flagellatus]|uniref:Type VI secretion system protein ImpG n=1 Tax=Primorskyibacter flagellatus TaxID=1387277 RepID=A0A917EDX5_9RHOB|nr:type VI secretion system baseplate subunit TssF [Primorskyibacter flagellatus]GGE22576.1 type VI secretion system protein ImpG [Primorskyibacter flagellatus]